MTAGIASARRYVVHGRSSESDRLVPTACKNVLGPWKASSLAPPFPVPVRSRTFVSAATNAAGVVVVVVVVDCGGCVARNLLFGGDSSSTAAPLRGARFPGGGGVCLLWTRQNKDVTAQPVFTSCGKKQGAYPRHRAVSQSHTIAAKLHGARVCCCCLSSH